MTNGLNKKLDYRECFVAFIDILGFKEFVKESQNNPETVAILVNALNRIALDTPQSTHTKARRDDEGKFLGYDTSVLQVRPFSDCVCLFIPVAPKKLAWLLRSVRYIHDRMLELGVCIRGAITIGGMYWDDVWGAKSSEIQKELANQQFKMVGQVPPQTETAESSSDVLYEADAGGFPITLGPGLVNAYSLETSAAVYPRVIAGSSLTEYLQNNEAEKAFPLTGPSPEDSRIPLNTFFRQSEDGLLFLDLLHSNIDRQDTERIIRQSNSDGPPTWRWERKISSHSDIVTLAHDLATKQLSENLPDSVKAKYGWLKNYASKYLFSVNVEDIE